MHNKMKRLKKQNVTPRPSFLSITSPYLQIALYHFEQKRFSLLFKNSYKSREQMKNKAK